MSSLRLNKVNGSMMNSSSASTVRLNPNQDYLECMNVLAKVFNEVQADEYNLKGSQLEKFQEKRLERLYRTYNKVGPAVFAQTLMRLMVVPFQQKDSNPYIRRTLDFFYVLLAWDQWREGEGSPAKISPDESFMSVASNMTLNTTLGEDDSSDMLPVLILKQCEKYANESRQQIRLRIMQTIAKIIPEIVPVTNMGKRLRQRLVRMLFIRSKDKSEQIRALSVKILSSFFGEHLPFQALIRDVIVDRMAFDPSPNVRAQAVSSIEATDELIEHIVERAGDPVPSVRVAALTRITDSISLSSLTLEMREAILECNATTGENPKNIQKAMNSLLRKWLDSVEGDPVKLLQVLKPQKRIKLCRKALDLLYDQPAEDAFETISKWILNEDKFPEESLCLEVTFLWLYMHDRFKNEPYIMNKLTLSVDLMIEYIDEYLDVIEEEENLDEGDISCRSSMLADLLNILCHLPKEEGERRAIITFLPGLYSKKKLMDVRNSSLAVKLINVCSDISNEQPLVDLVNSVLDSDRQSTIRSKLKTPQPEEDANNEIEDEHSLKIELGSLRHQTKQLELRRDDAVKNNDFHKAQDYQNQIDQLEKRIEVVRKKIDKMNESFNMSMSETQDEQDDKWIFSDETMLITICMVKTNILYVDCISDFTRTFYEMYVTKAVVACKSPEVRAQALELMCIVALGIESECAKAAGFCLTGLLRDKEVVQVAALKCLYDLVLRYSFAKLGEYTEVQSILMGQLTDSKPNAANNDNPQVLLKQYLLSFVNLPNQRLVKVSVAGILKLLFKKELSNSSKLMVELIRKWAIPMHDVKVKFKDVEVMVPMYATIGENEAIEVAKCLVPCIRKTILEIRLKAEGVDDAPHPDIEYMISFILKATEPTRLANFDIQRPYIGHETIAISALKELHKIDLSTEERCHYAKLLKLLNLAQCPYDSCNRLKHACQEILVESCTRQVTNLLAGFSSYLDSLMSGSEDNIEDTHRGAFEEDEE